MLLDKFQYLLGDIGVGTDVAAIHLPVAQLFHLGILGWHDANGNLRRLAEVRTIDCNGRHRPTPQSLPGFLAQALEEPIFLHIAPSATLPFTIGAGVALPYSITSSARASTVAGISRPSALAVFKLITSSYLVGACTGRSAVFSPLCIRSTQPAPPPPWSTSCAPSQIPPPPAARARSGLNYL